MLKESLWIRIEEEEDLKIKWHLSDILKQVEDADIIVEVEGGVANVTYPETGSVLIVDWDNIYS